MTDPVDDRPERLRVLRSVASGRRRFVVGAALLATLATGCTVALPLAVRSLVNGLSEPGGLVASAGLLAVLALVGAFASGASAALLGHATESMVRDLRMRMIRHTLRLPVPLVRKWGAGDLVTRTVADVANLRSVVELGVVQFPTAAMQVVLTVGVMAYLDPVLLGITVGCFAVAGGAVTLMLRSIRRHAGHQQGIIGGLATDYTAALDALVTLKSSRAEVQTAAGLDHSAERGMIAAQSMAKLQSLISPVMQFGQQAAMIGVVLGSGVRLSTGALGIADFAAFLLYLLQLVGPLTILGMGAGRLQMGLTARRRVDELMAAPAESGGTARPHARVRPALEFRRAGVAHPDGSPALREVTFTAPRVGLTAVVGPSGAGKTTLLHAADRLTGPHTGEILLHGVDLAEWDLAALRQTVSLVDQDCTLVRGTVRANLVLGHSEPLPDEELELALERVGLTLEIAGLPAGLDTALGSGTALSGGQRQRLTIARALLRRSDVVLLDEPTSALDGGNERMLRVALRTLAASACVVVVAHRLSTVHDADRIVLLDGGTVVDVGTHDELVHRCPAYRELVLGQLMPAWDEEPEPLDTAL